MSNDLIGRVMSDDDIFNDIIKRFDLGAENLNGSRLRTTYSIGHGRATRLLDRLCAHRAEMNSLIDEVSADVRELAAGGLVNDAAPPANSSYKAADQGSNIERYGNVQAADSEAPRLYGTGQASNSSLSDGTAGVQLDRQVSGRGTAGWFNLIVCGVLSLMINGDHAFTAHGALNVLARVLATTIPPVVGAFAAHSFGRDRGDWFGYLVIVLVYVVVMTETVVAGGSVFDHVMPVPLNFAVPGAVDLCTDDRPPAGARREPESPLARGWRPGLPTTAAVP